MEGVYFGYFQLAIKKKKNDKYEQNKQELDSHTSTFSTAIMSYKSSNSNSSISSNTSVISIDGGNATEKTALIDSSKRTPMYYNGTFDTNLVERN